MSEIKLKNINKRFQDVTVIKELDLTISDGEFFTFVGPSGCGKSTILNMIAGLEDVTGGEIYFDDVCVNRLSPRERDVAMVFQSYALYPHMTIYENIAFPLRMKKIKQDTVDAEVKRIASLIGLEDLLGRKPRELSGGQRQRVALGRAIIRKPKVFLMDEPLSNLDARLRVEMRAELKKLHQELRITTIYVTHDQAEAMSLSERMAVMQKGEIRQTGSPLEIYNDPADIFIAGFIGSPAMNFMAADIASQTPFSVKIQGEIFHPEVKSYPESGKVVVGIRPEDIIVSSVKEPGAREGILTLIEPLGSEKWVKFKWGTAELDGKASREEELSLNAAAFFDVKNDKIHVFDQETGERL